MNYAIKELKRMGTILKNDSILKNSSDEHFTAADALEHKIFINVSTDVISTLLDCQESVMKGLENWGSRFLARKDEQIKKADELMEALKFFRPNYKTHQ